MNHQQYLTNVCRVCGLKKCEEIDHSKKINSYMIRFVSNAFDIDLSNEDANVFPTGFCKQCNSKAMYDDKKKKKTKYSYLKMRHQGTLSSTEPHRFEPHSDDTCPCIEREIPLDHETPSKYEYLQDHPIISPSSTPAGRPAGSKAVATRRNIMVSESVLVTPPGEEPELKKIRVNLKSSYPSAQSLMPDTAEVLSCRLCNRVPIDPRITPCEHIFCQPCIVNWKETLGIRNIYILYVHHVLVLLLH